MNSAPTNARIAMPRLLPGPNVRQPIRYSRARSGLAAGLRSAFRSGFDPLQRPASFICYSPGKVPITGSRIGPGTTRTDPGFRAKEFRMRPSIVATAAVAAILGLAAPATAQNAPEPKVNQLIVYGDDKCPESTDDTITVCARKDEGERFRIPAPLR